MKIIAISGYAGAGKTSFAAFMENLLLQSGHTALVTNFDSYPMQIFCELKRKGMVELFEKTNDRNKNRGDLYVFQKGMEEIFGKDVWTVSLIEQIQKIKRREQADFLIIDDLATEQQKDALLSLGIPIHFVKLIREEVIPKADEAWYLSGKTHGLLSQDQFFQYYNIVADNPLATAKADITIVNDASLERLGEVAYEYLLKINIDLKLKDHV